MHCEGCAVMFPAGGPTCRFCAAQQSCSTCTHADLISLREQRLASGVKVPPIGHPEYMPTVKSAFRTDGYVILAAIGKV